MGTVTPMALFMKRRGCRCKVHPKRKKYVKQKINKKRRQLLNEGLDEIKQAFNNDDNILEIDYYKDEEFIKVMSRQGVYAEFIEKRTTNSRLTIADCW